MAPRPPLPPFSLATAIQKVRLAEDGWNSRDPEKVSLAYTVDSRWRNRAEFPRGRDEIVAFLSRKWARELDYRDVYKRQPSGRMGLHYKNVETFGSRVNGSCKAGRPRTHYDQVTQEALVDTLIQAKAFRQFHRGRIAQHRLSVTNDDRHLFNLYVQSIQQVLRRGVGIEVDERVWVTIPAEELPESHRICRMTGADERNVAELLPY